MISCELAKQLKDAGFPMKMADATTSSETIFVYPSDGAHNYIYPTLSELIEACGDKLYNISTQLNDSSKGIWATNWSYEMMEGDSYGSTPEEAVARLYLALNKK